MRINICPKCGTKYLMSQCPKCDGLTPQAKLTPQEHIERLNDTQVKFIWNNIFFDAGDDATKALCLAEYDKRIGAENWPAHISR
jgi:hypothetical protein